MIVAGFGFRAGAGLPSQRAALALAQQGLPPVTHLATAADKTSELAPLAQALGLPLIGIAPDLLTGTLVITSSTVSHAARGTGSVAEAAALAAAGSSARLLTARHISEDRMATCAIAQGTLP